MNASVTSAREFAVRRELRATVPADVRKMSIDAAVNTLHLGGSAASAIRAGRICARLNHVARYGSTTPPGAA